MNDNQKILDILNEMDVFESNGGEEPYALVKVNEDSKQMLEEAGITLETALKYGDEEDFCIVALALSEGYANWWTGEKLMNIDKETVDEIKRLIQLTLDYSYYNPYEKLHEIEELLKYL